MEVQGRKYKVRLERWGWASSANKICFGIVLNSSRSLPNSTNIYTCISPKPLPSISTSIFPFLSLGHLASYSFPIFLELSVKYNSGSVTIPHLQTWPLVQHSWSSLTGSYALSPAPSLKVLHTCQVQFWALPKIALMAWIILH